LPLAHEQAAAYCERLGMSLSDYATKFANAPGTYLDAAGAPAQYHNGLTVSRTFALAIDEAAKLHKAAEVLITYAALLAPEPIPLFLFTEGHEEFSEPLASALAGDGLDEAVGALRAFSLLDRESIPDERDPSITTDTIRLHRLVREVAVSQTSAEARADIHCELIVAAARVYPSDVHRNAAAWPRARRLDVIALALVGESDKLPEGSEISAATLLSKLDSYRDGALAAFSDAQKLAERALAIRQKVLGADHPDTATSLNNIGGLLLAQSDLVGAWSYYERALAINEKALGPDHPATALGLNNLGYLLRERGNFAEARTYYERAVAINEKVFGRDHPDGALSLSNLGALLQAQGDLVGAQTYCERALAIREKEFGPDHPDTALSLNNLGALLVERGDLAGARPYYERALAIREKVLGSDHPDTAMSFNNLGTLLDSQGDLAGARPKYERAVAINEKVLGSDHPDTALSLNNLGYLLQTLGDHTGARRRYEAALSICDNKLGLAHRTTRTVAWNLAGLLDELGLAAEAEKVRQKFGV
jgi:tetratricopeptide (TPR) repeat protein